MKKKSSSIVTTIFIIIFLVGLSVMFYPTIANWWNIRHTSRVISTYQETVAQIDDSKEKELIAKAHEYNERLANTKAPFTNFDKIEGYEETLDLSGTGIMGFVSIPSIKVELPIYHGTSEGALQIASGHIQGSSLPVGGESTHAVISGHRGLPSAKLFTDLDQMVVGDTFTINIMNEVLTYEVEKILIIKPDEIDKLAIIPGGDFVTLMTCTPYGINSHRLLIRSHRIDTVAYRKVKVAADAVQIDRMKVMPFVAFPLFILLLIYWKLTANIRKRRNRKLNINSKNKYKFEVKL